MRKKKYGLLILYHALLLLTVYVLQGLVFPYVRVFGLVPLLLPVVSTGVAIFEGRVRGGVFGIFAGIFCDLSFNQPTIAFTVLLTVTGILIGFMADTVMSRGFPTFFVVCGGVLALMAFVQMFTLLFFEGAPPEQLLLVALYQTLYSLIFTIPIYFIVRLLGRTAQAV